jgi:hypothetical protein
MIRADNIWAPVFFRILYPQCGQVSALVETSPPHSLHFVMLMVSPLCRGMDHIVRQLACATRHGRKNQALDKAARPDLR